MSSISPTSLMRALVAKVHPGMRLGLDDPEPEYLAIEGTYVPVYGQLYMVDGWRDRFGQQPEFDVAFYARRFTVAEQAAQALEEMLVRYPVRVLVGERVAVLDRAVVTTATREVPWDADTGVTRFLGSYQLHTRN